MTSPGIFCLFMIDNIWEPILSSSTMILKSLKWKKRYDKQETKIEKYTHINTYIQYLFYSAGLLFCSLLLADVDMQLIKSKQNTHISGETQP